MIINRTARTCESGRPRGYDGAKRIVGRKRHALVNTDVRILAVIVGAASVRDRDGAGPLARTSRNCFPFVERNSAYLGYQGERVCRTSPVPVEVVQLTPGQIGFDVQPKYWVVE